MRTEDWPVEIQKILAHVLRRQRNDVPSSLPRYLEEADEVLAILAPHVILVETFVRAKEVMK